VVKDVTRLLSKTSVPAEGETKIIAAYSSKSGVGKTATAVNLVDCSARRGLRT